MATLKGHGLAHEGAPYLISETGEVIRAGAAYGGVSGRGRGLCSCGDVSDILTSAHQRKAWHREHKAEIVEATHD